jgi:arylsulfatase
MAGSAVAAALPGCAHNTPPANPSAKRPNIIVILADDMGFSDIGCYGGEIATPNLDMLAKNGMRFTQFYNNARCCPTRACLLTGLYPHQAGIGHMVDNKNNPAYQGYLNDSCVTIAEALKPAGYHPLMAGKWHAGEKRPHWPADRGFEHFYGLVSGASNYFQLEKGRTFAEDNTPIDPTSAPGFYMTNAFTDRALRYIDDYSRNTEPFFLYLAYTSPHWPLHALPEDIAKYKGKYMKGWDSLREERRQRMIDLGIIDKSTQLTPRDPKAKPWAELSQQQKEERDLRMAVYAAQIDRMDQNIGRLIAKLKETGQYENTLILFMADNGGCAEVVERSEDPSAPLGSKGSFLSYGVPWANASNTPFRLYKHWVHEGGISSPLIAHWPGHIQPNTFHRDPAHLIDIMPTCLELAAAKYPARFKGKSITPLEGRSLLPILQGQSNPPQRPIFWEHEGNRAVRQGQWKLVAQEGKPWELYDLSADRAELTNLADKNPAKVTELTDLYDRWAKRAGVVPWKELNKKKAAGA